MKNKTLILHYTSKYGYTGWMKKMSWFSSVQVHTARIMLKIFFFLHLFPTILGFKELPVNFRNSISRLRLRYCSIIPPFCTECVLSHSHE